MNKAAGSDFNREPEAFTNAAPVAGRGRTQVDSVAAARDRGGEKTNDSGNAIASNCTRGGTPQDV